MLVLRWDAKDANGSRMAGRIARQARHLRPIAQGDGFLLLGSDGSEVVTVAPGVFLLGSVFPHGTPPTRPASGALDERGFRAYCRQLLARHWGDYLALWHAPEAETPLCVFQEPIGMRGWTHWRHGGVHLLSDGPEPWLCRFPPVDLSIDEEEIAHLIRYPGEAAEIRPLRGVAPLPPGTIASVGPGGQRDERLWQPGDFCSPGREPATPAALARLVDQCVKDWSLRHRPALLELSGGLDSAIVARGLVEAGHSPLAAYTFFSDDLAGDERRFSREIVAHLGLEGREMPLMPVPLDAGLVGEIAIGLRPGVGSTTLFHDHILAQAGQATGAKALFTGRGGDALFFQHPTSWVAHDPWPAGWHKGRAALEALARWSQSPIWPVAAKAWLPAGWPQRLEGAWRLASGAKAVRPSRWAGDLRGLSPGKRMQVLAIAGDRSSFGPSRCGEVMQVIHPLLSQPLVEHALGQSLMGLTHGRRDRAALRAAFSGRLPQSIIERRGKGALTSFFGRVLARSTPLLRAELLEGALAQAGLIDRAALEQLIASDHLMQVDCYASLLNLLVVERWMRAWQARLSTPAP